MALNQVIVVGGGLAGLSAAHSVLEAGGTVLLLDKSAFMGGNSVKATSGINGAGTKAQEARGIKDSWKLFEDDTNLSFHAGKKGPVSPLVTALTYNSGSAVEWLIDRFGLDLSIVGQLGGQSVPRTHRGKERFPGMTITYALMDRLEKIMEARQGATIVTKATVTQLLTSGDGRVTGVVYTKDGQTHTAEGPVIIATGGFAADFTPNSLLTKYRPDLLHLSTTNGDHCTGDGIKMGEAVNAATVDMSHVQVHPTGLVHPDEPNAKLKFLAAEALRGTGALMLDANGHRFCNELGRRDYCSGEMFKNKGPFRLVLNSKCSKEIEWHCKHYQGRGLMKYFTNGAGLAADMGIPAGELEKTFKTYNEQAAKKSDPYGKKFFTNAPFVLNDTYYVAIITPVIHYCMGGLKVDEGARVINQSGKVIPGLYAAGEVAGGVHGINRLGGNSLLDCVVFGRIAGAEVSKDLLRTLPHRLQTITSHLQMRSVTVDGVTASLAVNNAARKAIIEVSFPAGGPATVQVQQTQQPAAAPAPPAAPAATPAATGQKGSYSRADVAKHNKENDCWVIIDKMVLDATKFLPDHPGGKKSIMLFAGKEATEEFDMLHKREVIDKYAPYTVIGTLKD
jgi:flavocytochrome c